MAYSFYNDNINNELYKATNEFITDKDLQVTKLILKTFKKFTEDQRPPKFNEFNKSFISIYSFSTTQKSAIYKAYRMQRDKNAKSARERFKERGQPKLNDVPINNEQIFKDANIVLNEFLNSLMLSSWQKLQNMIITYTNELNKLPKIGEEI